MASTDEGFKNNLREMIVGPPDPYLVEKARLAVCSAARDVADAVELLGILGIRETQS